MAYEHRQVRLVATAAIGALTAGRPGDIDRAAAAVKREADMANMGRAKFGVGQVVRHRVYPFRGVIFDIDPVFNNTEEWWLSIPAEVRPKKEQPFYHLLAENAETEYIAYVSEQNLLPDVSGKPLRHPQIRNLFAMGENGKYRALFLQNPH
jgi:heat shock protein HspQ